MNKKPLLLIALCGLFSTLVLAPPADRSPAAPEERFFDTAPAEYKGVRLVIFHPTINRAKDLVAMRRERLLDFEGLTVIGVFHENEKLDLAEVRGFLHAAGLSNVRFHSVRGALGFEDLYGRNACSEELERIFALSDGMIFFGGDDLPPRTYGRKTGLLTVVGDTSRNFIELSALFHFIGGSQNADHAPLLASRPRYPVLAICLGAQSLNVAAGGTLIQDIWSEVYGQTSLEDVLALGQQCWHTNPYARLHPEEGLLEDTFHAIRFAADSRLAVRLGLPAGATPSVLSAHHQALGQLGRDIVVEATSLDGRVVEAVSHARFPRVLGVQFHPEFHRLWDEVFPFRLLPGEPESASLRSVLEARPPSLDFQRKLWSLFSAALIDSASTRRPGSGAREKSVVDGLRLINYNR